MQSLTQLYKIGMGPSSSHTMGPRKAAEQFAAAYPHATSFKVTLYGSLAATGKGHLTDFALKEGFYPRPVNIVWEPAVFLPKHPNALLLQALDKAGHITAEQTVYSIGGGEICGKHMGSPRHKSVYPHRSMAEILDYTAQHKMLLWEYVEEYEGPAVWEYLATVWHTMQTTMNRGLDKRGVLPGPLNLERKARRYLHGAEQAPQYLRRKNNLYAYALACAEENACGGQVVTAPTCGSCGVVPAVCRLIKEIYDFEDSTIIHALATAGLF